MTMPNSGHTLAVGGPSGLVYISQAYVDELFQLVHSTHDVISLYHRKRHPQSTYKTVVDNKYTVGSYQLFSELHMGQSIFDSMLSKAP